MDAADDKNMVRIELGTPATGGSVRVYIPIEQFMTDTAYVDTLTSRINATVTKLKGLSGKL